MFTSKGFELTANLDLNQTKMAIDSILNNMGFSMVYAGMYNATAERGSRMASLAVGPLAGKNKVHTMLDITYRESGGVTSVSIEDNKKGIMKAMTLTGGTTKRVIQDIYNSVTEGLRRQGLYL
jgi:hypothetical protein